MNFSTSVKDISERDMPHELLHSTADVMQKQLLVVSSTDSNASTWQIWYSLGHLNISSAFSYKCLHNAGVYLYSLTCSSTQAAGNSKPEYRTLCDIPQASFSACKDCPNQKDRYHNCIVDDYKGCCLCAYLGKKEGIINLHDCIFCFSVRSPPSWMGQAKQRREAHSR